VNTVKFRAPAQPRPVQKAQLEGEKVARSDTFEWLSRAGFVARGLIYTIIGVLAVKVAIGAGGKTTDQQGALKTIAQQPFGKVLLILVAIGLAGYALWRFTHALLGHGPEEADSTFDRLAALGSGAAYALLCGIAVQILVSSADKSSGGSTHKAAAGALGWPAGPWLVGIAGAVLVGVGLYQGYRGLSKDFLEDAKTEEMSPRIRTLYKWIGIFGHMARMVVFGLVGAFLIKAAVEYDPQKAVGIDGALAKLAHNSYGPYLLGLVAAGLVAFGVYSLSDARYRRI
jgi:hypothetical protein